jgi:hypothetical protein
LEENNNDKRFITIKIDTSIKIVYSSFVKANRIG